MATTQRHRWLSVEQVGDITVVRFTQQDIIDEEASRAVGDQLLEMVEQHERRCLVINLANVQRITSIVVGKLIGINKRMQKLGGRLALCNINPVIRQIFDTLRLTRLFNIYEDEATALKSF
jgi:anti-anti-sigma factor